MQRLAPGGPPALEIYALEVSTLTADLRKAVVSSFRDKPANALLILTTRDYDPLEIVVVQKALRESRTPGAAVAVSHQFLSIDRRNPSRVHLRVLERLRTRRRAPGSLRIPGIGHWTAGTIGLASAQMTFRAFASSKHSSNTVCRGRS